MDLAKTMAKLRANSMTITAGAVHCHWRCGCTDQACAQAALFCSSAPPDLACQSYSGVSSFLPVWKPVSWACISVPDSSAWWQRLWLKVLQWGLVYSYHLPIPTSPHPGPKECSRTPCSLSVLWLWPLSLLILQPESPCICRTATMQAAHLNPPSYLCTCCLDIMLCVCPSGALFIKLLWLSHP